MHRVKPHEGGEAMIALARFKRVHWMLLAVLALTAAAVLAQKDSVSQGQNQQDKGQPEVTQANTEAVQPKAEAVQGNTEAAPAKTEDAPAQTGDDPKLISVPGGKALGMSILGNQEAPK